MHSKKLFSALKDMAWDQWNDEPVQDEIVQLYGFCAVHFERSRKRVAQNQAVVSIKKKDVFDEKIKEILQTPKGQFHLFNKLCSDFMKEFPKATSWLKWHLQPDRAVILFDACKSTDVDDLEKNRKRHKCTGKCWQTVSILSHEASRTKN